MTANRLPRSTRLKRKQLIRPLFDRRRTDVSSVAYGCVRIVFRMLPRQPQLTESAVQVGFSPGRGVRRAVDRNRIKRRLREAYRVRQSNLVQLLESTGNALTLMILFRGKPGDDRRCIARDLPVAIEMMIKQMSAGIAGLEKQIQE